LHSLRARMAPLLGGAMRRPTAVAAVGLATAWLLPAGIRSTHAIPVGGDSGRTSDLASSSRPEREHVSDEDAQATSSGRAAEVAQGEPEEEEKEEVTSTPEAAKDMRGPASGEKIDVAKEWRHLFVFQVGLPFLLIFVIVFECFHKRFSYVDWSMRVEYPAELQRLQIKSFFAGAFGWCREYLVSKEKRTSRTLLLVAILCFILLEGYLKYNWTMWMSRWYNLLQFPRGNFAAFWPVLGNFGILLMVDTMVGVYNDYTQSWFQLEWKTFMTRRFRNLWLSGRAFYLMELHYSEDDHMDNPDQRISEDTATFVETSFKLVTGVINCLIDLVIYVPMLWRLSPEKVFGHFKCKGWLLYVAILWAAGGNLMTHFVGRRLIALKYAMQRYEADYRFGLVQIRTNSESIAMLRGEQAEETSLGELWQHIRRANWELMVFNKTYWLVMAVYRHAEWMLSLIVFVPLYVMGFMSLAEMRMAQSALGHVRGDFEFIAKSWDTLTSWRAAVARLQTFEDRRAQVLKLMQQEGEDDAFLIKPIKVIKTLPADGAAPHMDDSAKKAALLSHEASSGDALATVQHIRVRGLTIRLPSGQMMVTADYFDVREGDRVLVSGSVGSGKSSMIRTLSGIWPYYELSAEGEIVMPNANDCLFVPRVPALPHVPLRDMVNYPELPGTYSDKQVLEVLELVGLTRLVARGSPPDVETEAEPKEPEAADEAGDVEAHLPADPEAAAVAALSKSADWSKVLSGGEQQRVVIAHVILRAPKFVFLDEATSSMSQEASLKLYQLMIDNLPRKTAIITISHDVPGMRPLHTAHYAIDTETRRLELMPAPESEAAAPSGA